MRSRRIVLLVVLLASMIGGPSVLNAVGASAAPPAPPGPLSGSSDLAEALRLEQAVDWHIWHRQGYEINYATSSRDAGAPGTDQATRYPGIVNIGGVADSALWTGTYLASESFRYQVAKKNAKSSRSSIDKKFWLAQKDEALNRIKPLLDQYHLLSHISKEWKWTDQDAANHSPGVSSDGKTIDLGTAPFKEAGEGLLFRACIPVGGRLYPWHPILDANGQRTGKFNEDRVYGSFAWSEPGSSTVTMYDCEDGTSRDAYAGASFGMATAFDFVDAADLNVVREDGTTSNLHDQVGADLQLLTRFLLEHHWTTPRPHSKVSTSNDLSSFISPLYVTSTGGRQHLLQIARHVSKPGSPEWIYFNDAWQQEMATNSQGNTLGSIVDTMSPTDSYYKWNLGHLVAYGLLRLEPPDAPLAERDRLRMGVGIMDATTRDDVNAHFETITYALTGEPGRLSSAIEHLRQWRDYRSRLDHPTAAQIAAGQVVVDNYGVCNDLGPVSPLATCKPEDKNQNTAYEQTPAGTVQVPPVYVTCNRATRDAQPSVTGPCRSVKPLPVGVRSPTDFLWQRPPFDLHGTEGVTHEAPGFDYLLPYWMIRYYTEVAPPTTVEPFPTWPGPTYQ